jgi:creatinine amidohydrolase/Fe(II)-dependent formamide hydrolase-like protein
LRPEIVRTELLEAHIPTPRVTGEQLDVFAGSTVLVDWRTAELTASGVIGRPDLATAVAERMWFEACADGLARLIDAIGELPPKPPSHATS